ncbi:MULTISPECIES: HAD family hydrolase [unclassified Mesorhizobium]|uniref:HAD family hydrolase n=1 Tax=unclassified Mesorhizobium TaxID=325217 RepID=UPI001CCEEB90|nr:MULTISPECIES: HAD family phosphatase [unclassified Mesorhizobium]MBZ9733272.1 HAD family phosphatase [Mesorhizobium sp. CA9]MBZ9814162.1 HAD family phosphatase [Mesorhizobium sp. CA7]MBZ9825940.1 HAD family phosphatase [Mesorhizobium sp. CA18]MBZ9831107.1 HAD family phosphatase [Mesorhizobium sp. CA2]MBZ9835218.1 HAD family phosphatase [Mesorhizobium sp. CA3]
MTEIRHIVFDIGKVLIHYDPDIPFSRLIPDAEERRWFFDNVCTSAWNIEQDRGRTWEEAESLLIAEHPAHAENIRNFRRHWHDMVPHAYDDSVALLEGLIDDGRDVTLLTNWASDTFREARARFPFLEKPRGITVSGDIGLIKPDRAIYDHHVASFGLDPAASLFIDDSQKNVDGAKAAGWQAVLFTDAETLKADLERLGIAA